MLKSVSVATAMASTLLASSACRAQVASELLHTADPEIEEVYVLGTLLPRPAKEVGSAISIIDAEALALRQTIVVSDVLRSVPGIAVNRTGPQGSLTQVRIRGAEGNHTLVYIDGVEANNPIFGEFNFANLVSADVERIDVIRGAQSALYGSEAIGGVISITTQSPREGLQGDIEVEGGAFGTSRGYLGAGAGTDTLGIRGAIQYYSTDGIDASPTGSEDDGFENLTASLKAQWRPRDRVLIEATLRSVDSEVDTDAQEFSFGTVQDANQVAESEDRYAKISATGSFLDGALTPRVFMSYAKSELTNLVDGRVGSESEGERLEYGLQLSYRIERDRMVHTLTGAVEREALDFVNRNITFGAFNAQDDEQTSLVGEYSFDFDGRLFLSAAFREDYNDVFDDATTYRGAAAYLFEDTGTRLHGSWGEGITDPTFNERFGFNPNSFVGNPDLKPESSESFDIGVEQTFMDERVVLDLTYFDADLEDEITTVFNPETSLSTPANQNGESKRSGLEVTLDAYAGDSLSINAQYTYLDAEGADELIEVRRPEHLASINVNWRGLNDRLSLNLGLDHNGDMEDLFFGFADPNFAPRRHIDAYTLLRVAGSYAVTDRIELFGRVENLLDEDYEEVIGFETPGIAAYLGFRIQVADR